MTDHSRRRFLNQLLAGSGAVLSAAALARAKDAPHSRLRLGWIGMDGHYKYTLDALSKTPNVELVAIAISEESAQRNRTKYEALPSGLKIYRDHREMLEKESLDIASLYTEHHQTADTVIDCANAGAHVYTEKPLATSLEDLQRVREAVARAGVQLTMMLNMRFSGMYKKIREIVDSGLIGEVAHCTAQKSYKVGSRPEWVKSRETFAGTIPYIGCHAIDLIRWCTGLRFVKGAAFHNNIGRPELRAMENSANVILLAESGASVSVRLDYCRPETAPSWGDDRLRIAGANGVVEAVGGKITLITQQEPPREIPAQPDSLQFPNFIAAIEGKEQLVIPAEDCFRITEIVLKLRNAADAQEMTVL